MKSVHVFDPPMCCSTGVCGPSVDPALVQFAADLGWLSERGVAVTRHNLSQEPRAFVETAVVRTALEAQGDDCLPLLVSDGRILSEGRYPSRSELAAMAGLEAAAALSNDAVLAAPSACCGGAGDPKNTGCC